MLKTSNINSRFNTHAATCLAVATVCVLVLYPEISEAATISGASSSNTGTSSLKEVSGLTHAYEHLRALVTGTAGKIIALTSFLLGTLSAAATSNMKIMIPSTGIAIAVGVGPSVIESVVGATF